MTEDISIFSHIVLEEISTNLFFIFISMAFKESGGVRLFPVLEKVFGFVVVERGVPIIPQKRAEHSIATLAVEIAGSKGWASAQGREAEGGSRRGKALGTGHRKRKRGG